MAERIVRLLAYLFQSRNKAVSAVKINPMPATGETTPLLRAIGANA
jgi:hypothetical protein